MSWSVSETFDDLSAWGETVTSTTYEGVGEGNAILYMYWMEWDVVKEYETSGAFTYEVAEEYGTYSEEKSVDVIVI